MDKTDEELIQEYLSGNENSFRFLIERYIKSLYNFVYRITQKSDLTEDIIQDTCLKIWKTVPKYKFGSNTFKSLIFTIAKNTTLDQLRKRKIYVFSDFDKEDGHNFILDTISDPETIPAKLIEKAEQKNTLNDALSSVSIEEREILTMHYQEDMTFEEIGEILKKPLNTVKSRHRRALTKLKKYLENCP